MSGHYRQQPTQRATARRLHSLSLMLVGWVLAAQVAVAAPAVVKDVRFSQRDQVTRIVFDTSSPVKHTIFTLRDPQRLVIDIKDTKLLSKPTGYRSSQSLVKNFRYARRNHHDLRVVLDLQQRAIPKSFVLPPQGRFGNRLVLDLRPRHGGKPAPVITATVPDQQARDVVVAIDAGHGGHDPGAIGKRGTREKDVVLAIARRVEGLLRQQRGIRPAMTRDRDVYLSLRERISRARAEKADVFLSIHADAARNRRAHGSSVYVLSKHGASSEAARWLARRENSADLVGGVSLDDKDDVLASVLLDLSQTATSRASVDLADDVLSSLKDVGAVRSRRVEHAGFVVLKSPDIPSTLIETAFISNPAEERRLRSASYQRSIAAAIRDGLQRYLSNHAPSGTLLAIDDQSEHVIRRGETLSTIAQQYHVSVGKIRRYNSLSGNQIQAGQILEIPNSDS